MMQKEKQLIPELRFPEFEGKWVEEKLGNVAKVERGKFTPRPRNNPIYYNGKIPFVQTSDVVNSKGKIKGFRQTLNEKGLKVSKLFPKGTILITVAANIGYSGVLQIDMACPDSLVGIKTNKNISNYYLNYRLEKEQSKMEYLAIDGAQKNINLDFLKPYVFSFPQLPEQQKIASFLTDVDAKITKLTKKKTFLAQYKKGVMQKIFKQEIRFKDDEGNVFSDWQEKKLGEVAIKQSSNISANTIEENVGEYKIYGASGFLKKIDFYRETESYISIVKDGAGVGRTLLCDAYSSVLGTLDIIKPKKDINLYFVYCLLNNLNFSKFITGSTIPHIYFKDYSTVKIKIPCLKEQTKIANFLSAIDLKIEALNTKIENSKTFKKGLLQQMFV